MNPLEKNKGPEDQDIGLEEQWQRVRAETIAASELQLDEHAAKGVLGQYTTALAVRYPKGDQPDDRELTEAIIRIRNMIRPEQLGSRKELLLDSRIFGSASEPIKLAGDRALIDCPGRVIQVSFGGKELRIIDVRGNTAWPVDYLLVDPTVFQDQTSSNGCLLLPEGSAFVIGRSSPWGFSMTDQVSRTHVLIGVARGKLKVEDLDSRNFTYVSAREQTEVDTEVISRSVMLTRDFHSVEVGESQKEFESLAVEQIDSLEGEAILRNTEFHASPFGEKDLTTEVLKQEGLHPRHRIRVGDNVMWYASEPYDAGHGRVAVVAYVEQEGKTIGRTFYRSNSHGVWRYLPNYIGGAEKVGWFGKGYGEASIPLPFVLQKAMAELSRERGAMRTVSRPELVFAGTARNLTAHGTKMDVSYLAQIEEIPLKLRGDFYPLGQEKKIPPGNMRFKDEMQGPDFQHILASWEGQTDMYGPITMEVYPSCDRKYRYLFCRDVDGRVWIGGVENNSEIQSVGLRRFWIDGGDLTTPAYEYSKQAGGYGNEAKSKDGYVDMYEHYLREIGVIREYQRVLADRQKT